jgi:hypothetical protein
MEGVTEGRRGTYEATGEVDADCAAVLAEVDVRERVEADAPGIVAGGRQGWHAVLIACR